jgi:ABC-2 type transport system ATP-binding protein
VRYPDSPRPAVESLDLDIGAGEVFGFIGPNGAGKTSTLKVLAGLMAPTSGEVEVAGVRVHANPADVRRKVGYLPDFFGVYDDLTCREYLDFFAAAQGLRRERRAAVVEEVLGLVDLQPKADALAGSLSRGMQQRLGLARVLVHEPEVLLLDEPASGLDPRARVEVREVLRELGAMGKTVVLSSHVLSDLASVCSTVGMIEQGRLVYSGSVRDAVEHASPPESAIRVAVAEGMDRARAVLEDWIAREAPGSVLDEVQGELRITVPAPAGTDLADPAAAGARTRVLAAAVSRRLVESGLSLTHLAAERADLERAFMTLTEGKLA